YLCSECNISFPSLSQLELHLLSHAESFDSKESSEVKEESMMDDDPSQHSPSSSESIDMKEEMKEDIGLNNCKFCAQTFDHRNELSIHLSTFHSDRPLYGCTQCPLVFSVKRDLSTHARVHSGESPHECNQCGKQFGTRQLLKKHCMWHTGERSHVCPHCSKAFFQKGHLTQHLMIHAGGRPHVCILCSKTFIFKFDLNRHMKIHSERGHNCTKCHRSFLKQSSLEDHAVKCKGGIQRTFSSTPTTPTTSALFLQKSLPLTPVISSSPYSCMLCGHMNISTSDLALHLSMVHFPSAPLPQMPEPVKLELDLPLSAVSSPNKMDENLSAFFPIKTEEMTTIDTATNSSCASSPQKASPLGSASPSMEDSRDLNTPPMAFECPTKCITCEGSAARIAQLEAALEATTTQLNTTNSLLTTALRMKQQELAPFPMPSLFSSLSSLNRSPSIPSFLTPSNLQSLLVNLQ
ncbi:hypothetical protein PFISCL1PPCAC_15123, partial [Pristionchus fissidentatus]